MKKAYTIDDWHKAFFAIDRGMKTRRRHINKFSIDRQSRILEIGCSDGVNLKALNSIGCKDVYGVDISMELLSKIKDNRRFCSDVCRLGIKDNAFDEIYCKGFLHHVPIRDVFGEMVRILRPGGVMHIVEPWPTVFRTVADFLTLYVLFPFSKTLYYRRIVLLFEREMYMFWLKTCKKDLFSEIERYDLRVIYKHFPFMNLYITVQKK